jgi:nicotinic acid mononucleotide adenylyltransferase
MEATFKYYFPSEPETVIDEAMKLAKEVKKVNGEFCFVWHSDSLSEMEPWQGWQNLLPNLLESLEEI